MILFPTKAAGTMPQPRWHGNLPTAASPSPESIPRAFLHQLDISAAACVHPVQPLMRLAHDAEHSLGWTSYVRPALAGRGLGGTFAYAALAQAVPGIFVAGISVDYRGFLPGAKPWCRLNGLYRQPGAAPRRRQAPRPHRAATTPWRDVQIMRSRLRRAMDPRASSRHAARHADNSRGRSDRHCRRAHSAAHPAASPHSGRLTTRPAADLAAGAARTATYYLPVLYSGDHG